MSSRRSTLKLIATAAGAASLPPLARAQAAGAAAGAGGPLKVGFVYVSPIGDAGWTFQHELGRREIEQVFGPKIATSFVESVAEGPDAERVIREMAQSGHRLVFATSFGYMNYVERVARAFPKTVFLHATGYKTARNLGTYNARFYEGRYLNGVIAGGMTKSGIIGYVGAFPIPEVLQGINAFARGARSVNPRAELRVIWVNSWYDPGREREAAMTLIAQNADILTHHTDSTAVMQAAEERGKWAFGYHSDMSKYGPKAQLSATTHHWGDFYRRTVERVLAGDWQTEQVWGGIREGMIALAPISEQVPAPLKASVAALEAEIRAGTLHPFTGPVVDQDGKLRHESGPMSDEALGKMDYFVQGVASRLPKR
ncbi:MAG: BMP family ABC transporter substrate-binding protein [Limnobacter sp.]|nr:BMP family ABC transporter substrate-binding protein [Limnobacter sp.]